MSDELKPWEMEWDIQDGEGSATSADPPWRKSANRMGTQARGFVRGLMDPISGLAQLAEEVSPKALQDKMFIWNEYLSKLGVTDPMHPQGLGPQLSQEEREYNQAREEAGLDGFDVPRTLGNILSPANIATVGAARAVPVMSKLPGVTKVVQGATSGAAIGASQPVYDGAPENARSRNIVTGAATGAALPVVGGAISRVISPRASVNPEVHLLREKGVRPSLGQTLGGWADRAEQKATSIPLLGSAVTDARRKGIETFNEATLRRTAERAKVAPPGEIGSIGVRELGDRISQGYDDVLTQVHHVTFDPQFRQGMNRITQMANSMTPDMRKRFHRILNDEFQNRLSPNGSMLGDVYKTASSQIGKRASNYMSSSSASERELGEALTELKSLMHQQVGRSNPDMAARLKELDRGWAELVRIEAAAKAAKNRNGVFTPAQLNSALASADRSVRKRAVGRGTSMMQDWARPAQNVLGGAYPDSGTAGRAMLGLGLLGGTATVSPLAAGTMAGMAGLYEIPGFLGGLASVRPKVAPKVAGALTQAVPYLTSGLVAASEP